MITPLAMVVSFSQNNLVINNNKINNTRTRDKKARIIQIFSLWVVNLIPKKKLKINNKKSNNS